MHQFSKSEEEIFVYCCFVVAAQALVPNMQYSLYGSREEINIMYKKSELFTQNGLSNTINLLFNIKVLYANFLWLQLQLQPMHFPVK